MAEFELLLNTLTIAVLEDTLCIAAINEVPLSTEFVLATNDTIILGAVDMP